jgi:hypothetical protein
MGRWDSPRGGRDDGQRGRVRVTDAAKHGSREPRRERPSRRGGGREGRGRIQDSRSGRRPMGDPFEPQLDTPAIALLASAPGPRESAAPSLLLPLVLAARDGDGLTARHGLSCLQWCVHPGRPPAGCRGGRRIGAWCVRLYVDSVRALPAVEWRPRPLELLWGPNAPPCQHRRDGDPETDEERNYKVPGAPLKASKDEAGRFAAEARRGGTAPGLPSLHRGLSVWWRVVLRSG